MDFQNKTAVISGAGSGIGQAVAKLLVKQGVQIYCFDKKIPAKKIAGVKYVKTDITRGNQVKKAFTKVKGKIDILFNNAGVMRRGKILESNEETFDLLFNVHVKGSWLMLKYGHAKLKTKATIVQMSSRHALNHPINPALYGLVKNTSLYMAELVANTYADYQVKILCPGPVDTPLSHIECNDDDWLKKEKMMCGPNDLAEQILKLIDSDKSRLIFDQEKCEYYLK